MGSQRLSQQVRGHWSFALWPEEWVTCPTSASKNEQNILWGSTLPTWFWGCFGHTGDRR